MISRAVMQSCGTTGSISRRASRKSLPSAATVAGELRARRITDRADPELPAHRFASVGGRSRSVGS